jgi:hypothetical protein
MEYDRKWEYLKDWYSERLRQDSAGEMTEKLSASNKVMVAHVDNKECCCHFGDLALHQPESFSGLRSDELLCCFLQALSTPKYICGS